MESSGTLTLRTYRAPERDKVFLEVTDTGGGIPPENLSKIFDPFFATKEIGKGTGLGLSMAYGIMEENQGKISIENTGPEGTTIRLEFPEEIASNKVLFDSIGWRIPCKISIPGVSCLTYLSKIGACEKIYHSHINRDSTYYKKTVY